MLSITDLPLVALLILAGATLVCSGLGRPWPRRSAFWARWVLRLGLLLALADVVAALHVLQPGGTLQARLWLVDPQLPITLSVDLSATVLAVMVLLAGLTVSFTTRERRPLASAALGLAVLGAVGAAFAGDLLSLYIGLQLSTLGGIGLSYARQPRAASARMVWAAITDQGVGLIWLGAMVVVLHRTSTLQLDAIPPGAVSPALAGLLLLPAVVRLAGCGLLAGSVSRGRSGQRARSLDVADWLTVVAIPTALLVLIRIQVLSGGTWPTQWFGTCMDLLAVAVAGLAVVLLLASREPVSRIWALPLSLTALVIVGFGENTADGTLLALAAGIFLELSCAFLPRALLGWREGGHRQQAGGREGGGWVRQLSAVSLVALPWVLGCEVALLGLDLSLPAGLGAAFAPALAYLLAIAGLVLTIPGLRRLAPVPIRWGWALWLPALGLLAAALLPGWAITLAAGALAPPGTTAGTLISAPDPLVLLVPGLILPVGYLVLLALLVGAAVWGMRLATAASSAVSEAGGGEILPEVSLPPKLELVLTGSSEPPRWLGEVRGWYSILVRLADREVGERPVWLWLAAAAVAAYMLAEWVKV
ncbi:MAG: hypothetical protein WA724_02555 [Candidatus Dormiibacterota bacterium]